jgi:hypothetical protein
MSKEKEKKAQSLLPAAYGVKYFESSRNSACAGALKLGGDQAAEALQSLQMREKGECSSSTFGSVNVASEEFIDITEVEVDLHRTMKGEGVFDAGVPILPSPSMTAATPIMPISRSELTGKDEVQEPR